MNEQEFEKAFSDPEFVNMLLDIETGEEMKKALADKGIDLSSEELDKFAEVLVCALQKGKGLGNKDLSKISGGVTRDFNQIKGELKISDEATKGLAALANVGQDIEKTLANKGVILTQDEAVKFDRIFARILENGKNRNPEGKLSDEVLGKISGGALSPKMQNALYIAAAVTGAVTLGAGIKYNLEKRGETQELKQAPSKESPEEYEKRLNAPVIPMTEIT